MANNAETRDDRPTLLMTRPRSSAEVFVAGLADDVRGRVDVCYSPLLDIRAYGKIPDLTGYAGVILTSANGVAFAGPGKGMTCYCVGKATGEKASKAGWRVKSVAPDADALIAMMAQDLPKGPLIHLSGVHQRGQIADRLTALGVETRSSPVYDQPLLSMTTEGGAIMAGPATTYVPLFSPRTGAQFAKHAGTLRHVRVLAISAAVAETVRHMPLEALVVAEQPGGADMRRGLEMMVRGDTLP